MATRLEQKKALRKWGFKVLALYDPVIGEFFVFVYEKDNVKIGWNIRQQVGGYSIDNESYVILSWEVLKDLMEQIL